jgi:hypothetical protein
MLVNVQSNQRIIMFFHLVAGSAPSSFRGQMQLVAMSRAPDQ